MALHLYVFCRQLLNCFIAKALCFEVAHDIDGAYRICISIARCILKDASIVILDEATASVDADNECHIQQAISELCKGNLLDIGGGALTIKSAEKYPRAVRWDELLGQNMGLCPEPV